MQKKINRTKTKASGIELERITAELREMTQRAENEAGVMRAMRQIILDLFHPMSGHKKTCPAKINKKKLCKCGWSLVATRYNAALERARWLAAEYYDDKTDPMAGKKWDDDATAGLPPLPWRWVAAKYLVDANGRRIASILTANKTQKKAIANYIMQRVNRRFLNWEARLLQSGESRD